MGSHTKFLTGSWPDDKHARTKPETLPALDEKIFLHLLKEMV